jgi:hypothetical protein
MKASDEIRRTDMYHHGLALVLAIVLLVTTLSGGSAEDDDPEYSTPYRCVVMTDSGMPLHAGRDTSTYLLCLGYVF